MHQTCQVITAEDRLVELVVLDVDQGQLEGRQTCVDEAQMRPAAGSWATIRQGKLPAVHT